MKIDCVITWVNPSDQSWLKDYEKVTGKKTKNSNRYYDWGMLKYLLRSIEKNIPWFNKIYIVTCGHFPDWLDINNERLKLIKHEDIYDDINDLPTFNSNSIEFNLANIEGLSEDFIYFNDDCLILNPLNKERFFMNDKPLDFLCRSIPRKGFLYNKFFKVDEFPITINNTLDFLNQVNVHKEKKMWVYNNSCYPIHKRVFNVLSKIFIDNEFAIEHYHHIMPYKKSHLLMCNRKYKEEIKKTISSKLRHEDNITTVLYRYDRLISGDFYPYYPEDAYFKNIKTQKDVLEVINAMSCHSIMCINDAVKDVSDDERLKIKNLIIHELECKFMYKSSFEV